MKALKCRTLAAVSLVMLVCLQMPCCHSQVSKICNSLKSKYFNKNSHIEVVDNCILHTYTCSALPMLFRRSL